MAAPIRLSSLALVSRRMSLKRVAQDGVPYPFGGCLTFACLWLSLSSIEDCKCDIVRRLISYFVRRIGQIGARGPTRVV